MISHNEFDVFRCLKEDPTKMGKTDINVWTKNVQNVRNNAMKLFESFQRKIIHLSYTFFLVCLLCCYMPLRWNFYCLFCFRFTVLAFAHTLQQLFSTIMKMYTQPQILYIYKLWIFRHNFLTSFHHVASIHL